jgi:hypothetical protein
MAVIANKSQLSMWLLLLHIGACLLHLLLYVVLMLNHAAAPLLYCRDIKTDRQTVWDLCMFPCVYVCLFPSV